MKIFLKNKLPIQCKGELSQSCVAMGITDWGSLIHYLRSLPYGRISNSRSLELVFSEGRGTDSIKHALLAKVAHENGMKDLKLVLCTYHIDEASHPEAGQVLKHYCLPAIPEARCFIKYDGRIWHLMQDDAASKPEIISEIEIAPQQIGNFKKRYHKKYIQSWLQIEHLHKHWNADQIWSIREECIEAAEGNWESCMQLLCCA
ncbi:MAG: hypothetical protein ACLFT3_11295 [Cyclobacteriaceae bacterium]